MGGSSLSNSLIITASVLGVGLCIPAIIWRSFYAHYMVKLPAEAWRNNTVLNNTAGLLATSMVDHIFWLLSSIALFIGGQKGFRPVMWMWMFVTWSVIIIDSAFFMYISYQKYELAKKGLLPQLQLAEKNHQPEDPLLVQNYAITFAPLVAVADLAVIHMLLLLINIILAFLTVKIGCYANELSREIPAWTGSEYKQGRILDPTELQQPVHLPDQIPQIRVNGYRNPAYSRSAEDIHYSDRPVANRFRRNVRDELAPDYNDRRESRYDVRY